MNPIVSHLISGRVHFTALPVMVVCLVLCDRITRPDLHRLVTVLVWNTSLLGVSTAAYPWWWLGLFATSIGLWTIRTWLPQTGLMQQIAVASPVAIATVLIATEISWAMQPVVIPVAERSVVVLGDSISAGLDEGEGTPWPFQLRDAYHVQVYNLSEAGATTADGLKNISQTDHFPGLVIVELGGNDLLGGRTHAEFESNFDGILSHLRRHNRSIALVELPLLPGKNAWGATQRRLARKYHCSLIPKRLLVDVLATPGSTVDTLHLSQAGHRRLADQIWSVIEPALPRQLSSGMPPVE